MAGPKYLIMKILRFIVIFFVIECNIILLTFASSGFVKIVSSNSDVKVLVISFTSTAWLWLGFFMYLTLLLRRKTLLTFFQDFKNCLIPMNNMNFSHHEDGSKKYFVWMTYLLYLVVMLVMQIKGCLSVTQYVNDASIDGFKDISSILILTMIILSDSVNSVWLSFFTGLADIIPILIYFQAAVAVEILVQQWQSLVDFILQEKEKKKKNRLLMENQLGSAAHVIEIEIRRISRLYDSIVHLVSRADQLFGHVVIFSQFLSFFVICSLTTVLIRGSNNPEYFVTFPYILVVFTLRLVWPIFMISKLHGSAARLRSSVLSFHCTSSLKEKAIKTLLIQLQDDKLAASPMGLYSITPSLMLSILNTIVTYIIILLQAGGQSSQ